MGCDIHIVLEQKHNDIWVGLRQLGYLNAAPYCHYNGGVTDLSVGFLSHKLKERDYQFFWALAGVRHGDGKPGVARGLPDDMSTLSRMVLEEDVDMHSASWMSLKELLPLIEEHKIGNPVAAAVANKLLNKTPQDIQTEWIGEELDDPDDLGNFRIVFAFDN